MLLNNVKLNIKWKLESLWIQLLGYYHVLQVVSAAQIKQSMWDSEPSGYPNPHHSPSFHWNWVTVDLYVIQMSKEVRWLIWGMSTVSETFIEDLEISLCLYTYVRLGEKEHI